MQPIDVKIKSIDYSTRFLYPNRTIQIRPSSSTEILTPTRAATDYEFRQKTLIPTPIPLRNPIYISSEDLNYSEFEKFMHKNGYYATVISRMEVKSRQSQHALLRLFLLRPTTTDKIDEKTKTKIYSPMNLLKKNPILLERFIRHLIQMQNEIGLNPITIPFIDLPFSELREQIVEIDKSIAILGKQPVFFLDMAYQDFPKTLDLLINQLQLNAIGLYFKPYRRAHLAYEALRDYVDKDVAFFSVNVDRTDVKDTFTSVSTMHYLPFLGNDIYSIKRPMGFQKQEIDERGHVHTVPFDYSLSHIDLFDKETLCITPIRQTQSLINRLIAEYRSDSFIPTILGNFEEANGKKANYEVLNAFSKVSELKDSSSAFSVLQQYVNQNSTKDYIQEKVELKRGIYKIMEIS